MNSDHDASDLTPDARESNGFGSPSYEIRQIVLRMVTTFVTSVLVIVLLAAGWWPLAVVVGIAGVGVSLWLGRRFRRDRIDEAVAAAAAHDAAEAERREGRGV